MSHLANLADYLGRWLDILGTCPWLWWMGVEPHSKGLAFLKRRAVDRSFLLKLVTVLVVPLLTAIFSSVAVIVTIRTNQAVMSNKIEELRKDVDTNTRSVERIREEHNQWLQRELDRLNKK